jgi:hypothetical protein
MRILLVTTRFPLPARRGQQVRTMEWIEALADDHDVALVSPAGGDVSRLPATVTAFFHRASAAAAVFGLVRGGLSGRPFQEGLYDTAASRSAVRGAVESFRPEVLVAQMVRCAWAVDAARTVDPTLPVVFDAIDSMALHFGRRAAAAPWHLRTMLRIEARAVPPPGGEPGVHGVPLGGRRGAGRGRPGRWARDRHPGRRSPGAGRGGRDQRRPPWP